MEWLKHLDPSSPWWNVAEGLGTVVAAFLAVFAIWQSGRQGRKASDRMRRERRIDFELNLLKELLDLVVQHPASGRDMEIKTRLRLLPLNELPTWDAVFEMNGPISDIKAETERLGQGVPSDRRHEVEERMLTERINVRQRMRYEVRSVISDRLSERG